MVRLPIPFYDQLPKALKQKKKHMENTNGAFHIGKHIAQYKGQ